MTKRTQSNAKPLKPVKPKEKKENNLILPEDLQGRRYKVTGFKLTPEVSLIDTIGRHGRRDVGLARRMRGTPRG